MLPLLEFAALKLGVYQRKADDNFLDGNNIIIVIYDASAP
jgi:hypothetical protein